MIGTFATNFLVGAGAKFVVGIIGTAMENRHQYMIATANIAMDKLEKMYGGEDKVTDKLSRRVRNIIALMLVGTLCFLVMWIVVKDPYMHYRVMVDVTPGLFSNFTAFVPKGTVTVSAASILWSFFELASMACGYYFIKIGKSR